MTTLKLPNDPRAQTLLAEMDARLFAAIDEFPDALRAVALARGTYDGTANRDRFEGLSGMNPGLTCTPWMFWEASSSLDHERFVDIGLGGGMVILGSILRDHLSDGQVERVEETTRLRSEFQERGTACLQRALGSDDPYWAHHERLLEEHRRGLALETEWRRAPERLTDAVFVEAVSAKFAPIALTMVAVLSAAERSEIAEPVERSIKHLAVASQLLDDLGDWEDDLEARRLTWFIKSLDADFDWRNMRWPSTDDLQGQIDQDWSEIRLLNWAIEWLNRSKEAVEDIPCSAWLAYLDGFSEIAEGHLSGRTARHLARSIEDLLSE